MKNVKDFRCYVKAIGCNSECSKWAPCCNSDQNRPSISAVETRRPNVTSRRGIKRVNTYIRQHFFFHKLSGIFQRRQLKKNPRTEVYNQFGYLQLPLKLTSLLISHIKCPFLLVRGCYGGFLILCQVILVFLGQPGKGVGESLRALTEMRRMLGMRRGMKCTQRASLRRGGARGGVIPEPRQPAWAAGSGSRGREGTKHPENWRLHGRSDFTATQPSICISIDPATVIRDPSRFTSSIPKPWPAPTR